LVFAYMLARPNITMAVPFDASVSSSGQANVYIDAFSKNNITVRTEYTLNTGLYGPLDAFCVEAISAPTGSARYELVAPEGLQAAAWVAEQYWAGTKPGFTKEEYQIAIWELVFDPKDVTTDRLKNGLFQLIDGADKAKVYDILSWQRGNPSSDVWLAQSPVNGSAGVTNVQDYLVRVPEPATMLLLGTGLLGLAGFGRKNLFKRA